MGPHVPNAWAEDGWHGSPPSELVDVFTYLTILLTIGDLTVESGILTSSQGEMFWSYRQSLFLYAADPLVNKIAVDLSRMVRVCIQQLTPKKKVEGGGKTSRMTYGKEERLPSVRMPERSRWQPACAVTVIARGRMRLS